jgi:hypothetical protein
MCEKRIVRLLIPWPLLLARRRGDRVLGTLVDGTWNVPTTLVDGTRNVPTTLIFVVLSPSFPIVHLALIVLEV